jgi:hypothetical protein
MSDAKPLTAWATTSLGLSALGCMGAVSFLLLLEHYEDIARGSAGVGAIFGFGHAVLAAGTCLLSIFCGCIAFLRIRSGEFSGRRQAWLGILLGASPLVLALIWFIATRGGGLF